MFVDTHKELMLFLLSTPNIFLGEMYLDYYKNPLFLFHCYIVQYQGVQCKAVLEVNFFRIFEIIIFLLCCCYIRPSARCGGYI